MFSYWNKTLPSFLSKVQAQAGSLLNAVATLIGATEAEEREKALEALRGIIVQKHSDFDNNDMHDAQEFLTVLLQNLAVSFSVEDSFNDLRGYL